MIGINGYNRFLVGCVLGLGLVLGGFAHSQPASAEAAGRNFNLRASPDAESRTAAGAPEDQAPAEDQASAEAYTIQEIVAAGHNFFGKTTGGLAKAVQHSFGYAGAPTGYIIGEEASAAFLGGLRYGEGVLHMKDGVRRKVYWQGPSLGFDFGANGSRTMVLIYHMQQPEQLYQRYGGIEGSFYFIGGVGVNFQRSPDVLLAPIRTGLGARLGANVGYLKYTEKPTWNPF